MTALVAADTSRMALRYIEEQSYNTTPATPTFNELRMTQQSINFALKGTVSNEIRSDRMVSDLIVVDADVSGGTEVEANLNGAADELLAAVLFNTWTLTPTKTGSAQVSAIVGSTHTMTINAGGASYKANHLIYNSGFSVAANNGVFKVASNTGTTIVTAAGLADETTSGTTLQTKIVGFVSASAADVRAAITPTRLTSTTTDFTTFGLVVGQWVKIGGTATADKFATTANNGWARISAIAAAALTFDIAPSGFAADTATAVALKVWFGDTVRNGTTKRSFSLERAHLDVNQFFKFTGMITSGIDFKMQPGSILTGAFNWMGSGAAGPAGVTYATTVNSAPTNDVLNSASDLTNVIVNGAPSGIVQSMDLKLDNNLRGQKVLATLGNAGVGAGRFDTSGTLTAYFPDATLYGLYTAQTPVSVALTYLRNSQGFVQTIPKVKLESCSINAGAVNTDVMLNLGLRGLRDPTYAYQTGFDRLWYVEA